MQTLSNETLTLLLVIVVVVIAAGVGIWFFNRKQRSQNLREKFGPEYAYTMEKAGDDQNVAEKALKEREQRVVKLDIHPLNETERNRYHGEWIQIQADFVDDPVKSVKEANRLISEVMIARGFPIADFEQRAADLSVLYPNFVLNYRLAEAIALKIESNGASTEDLRQAMVYYRSLYEELLGTAEVKEFETREKQVATL